MKNSLCQIWTAAGEYATIRTVIIMDNTSTLSAVLARAEEEELDICGLRFQSETASSALYTGGSVDGCSFFACRLPQAGFSGTMFFDCVFENCDLSGARFRGCSMKNVTFRDCRLTGADFRDAVSSDAAFIDCAVSYSNHGMAVYKKCRFQGGTFQESSFFEVEWKNCTVETDLTLAEFQRAKLGGADLRKSTLYGAVFSADSLRGVTVSREQAADLAVLLGLVIK